MHPKFEIGARIPTALEHQRQVVPDWCELVLEVREGSRGPVSRHHFTRAAGEQVIDSLHHALHPWAGRSLIDMLWQELDEVTDRLMVDQSEPHDVGRAQGLAWSLAVIRNPYTPSYESIRDEAIERWEARQG